MKTTVIEIRTGDQPGVVDLTDHVSGFCHGNGDGLVNIFLPHATAGLALIEIGSGTGQDLLGTLARLLPTAYPWQHEHGSPGHGGDHVLPALVSPSLTLPVVDGRVTLGTWQSVALVDPNRDNPTRRVRLSFLPG